MKRTRLLSVLIFSFLLASSSVAEESMSRLFPLPVREAEEALISWMIASGFNVSSRSAGMGEIQLTGMKGKEVWEITLKPHSPLASSIEVRQEVNGRTEKDRVDEVWSFLDRYSEGQRSARGEVGQETPAAVLSRGSSVVCIKATVEAGEIQFSGFMVGKKGLIVSTAHDLNTIRAITVTLNNGKELKGDLIKIDPHRDLILLDSHLNGEASISLENGRRFLKNGEKIYTIGCPMNAQRTIHSGVIDGPLRNAGGSPLWQVTMETLPGSSGSPVFDSQGNLAAVVKGRYRGTDSVGFLIPFETIIEFLKEK